MAYTTLREARMCVMRKQEFTGNSIYARWYTDEDTRRSWYVVYSYGDHFPMYVFDEEAGMWFANSDKYSSTTSRHQSACCPPNIHEHYGTERMKDIARRGIVALAAQRIGVAA